MLDLDRLFAGPAQGVEVGTKNDAEGLAEASPAALDVGTETGIAGSAESAKLPQKVGIPTSFPPVPTRGGNAGPISGAGFRGVPTVPTVPTSKKHEPEKTTSAPAGVGAGSSFRAGFPWPVSGSHRHEVNPAAVVLCFHAMTALAASAAEVVEALRTLHDFPPAEQQRMWSDACEARGLVPWRLLTFPAVEQEHDCMGCAHLASASGPLIEGDRRRFRWRCGLGYPVREVARASERIITAPPECASWDRYAPEPR